MAETKIRVESSNKVGLINTLFDTKPTNINNSKSDDSKTKTFVPGTLPHQNI
jgi:hypothetical protein